jgi:hypothetical protein
MAQCGVQGGQSDSVTVRAWPVSDRHRRPPAGARRQSGLHLRLLGHFQGIIHLDTQVSDGTFQLGMAQEQLNDP